MLNHYPAILTTDDEKERYDALLKKVNERSQVLSYSAITHFFTSPLEFIRYKCVKRERDTAAQLKGRVSHCLILEPHLFDKEYIIQEMPTPLSKQQREFARMVAEGTDYIEAYAANYKSTRKTGGFKEGTEQKALEGLQDYINFLKAQGKRTAVPRSVYDHCKMMADALHENKVSGPIIRSLTETEKEVEWEYKGFKWRGYVDGIGEELHIGDKYFPKYRIDLKTVVDASPQAMYRKIKYDTLPFQGACYTIADGDYETPYIIVAIDNKHNVGVYRISDGQLSDAKRRLDRYIQKFKDCALSNRWNESFEFYNDEESGIFEF